MTILADASAIVAIMMREGDADRLQDILGQHDDRLYCATGAWEAIRAVARIHKKTTDITKASSAVEQFFRNLDFRMVLIGDAERRLAIEAHRLYGKGTRHLARLNMGDCFAYACAKANDAALLYKGNDFIHTDLA